MAELIAEEIGCRRGERPVFCGLSFRLPAGGALLLTGANGSGKSSLLRLLAGFSAPVSGRLLWGAAAIAEDPAAHRARVHYLGHLDGIKGALGGRETLRYWAALRGLALGRADARIDRALAAFALEAAADWPCRWLSAGQRRRLALSRLLLTPAPLWLLDEPTSALDRDGEARLERAIAAHRAAGGRVVAATHAPLALAAAQVLALEDFAPLPDAPA